MNIILAEEGISGELSPEQTFSKAVIVFGRDSFECDVAFDNEKYPMVSRKHAELRWTSGKWTIVDLNSSYGTFLDGNRISEPRNVPVGGLLQLGVDGPRMRVVWFEVLSNSGFDLGQQANVNVAPIVPPDRIPIANVGQGAVLAAAEQKPVDSRPNTPAKAQVEFVGDKPRAPFILSKYQNWLGREPDCEIVFDASEAMVSRKHAEIRIEGADYVICDNNSFNGTLVNGKRIAASVTLVHNDEIQLGLGGPLLRFISRTQTTPSDMKLAGIGASRIVPNAGSSSAGEVVGSETMVFKAESSLGGGIATAAAQPELLMSVGFGGGSVLTIGREDTNDIRLDGLQISKRHARIHRTGEGFTIEDLSSTNGIFINGARVSRQAITPEDSVQIGSFLLRIDGSGGIGVFDTRSKTRIDAVNITTEVGNRFCGGKIKLIDGISLSFQPNEFIGILGPSGAGKSTLIEALNGVRPATDGSVFVNELDLYRHRDSLKQAIGYVPQDDIIHRELSVYMTLFYVAKLRLSRDVTSNEIDQIINEVLDLSGLAEQRDIPVAKLSGGQRKRVSIAVELITKPSVIFLDEPTSGLDPATEDRVMKLFRQIAEAGRTVIMTTHAMENVKLFDKIVVLMRGKLVFYGSPGDALNFLGAANFKQLFDKLEEPIETGVRQHGESNRSNISENVAEEWKRKFLETSQFNLLIQTPLLELGARTSRGRRNKNRLGLTGAISQWFTLSRRYARVLLKDKLNLLILFAQAPIIALLLFFVMGSNQPRDFLYFAVSLVAIWFGTSVAAREIVRERPVYRRERMFNLGILPYLASKLFVLGFIVTLQCSSVFIPLKLLDLTGLMPMPGELFGIPQFWAMLLTAAVGVAIGLFVSSLVRTSEMATSVVPLILIPQILFSGLVGVPSGLNRVVGLTVPTAWSFDTMKRFSTLDTLEEEGAVPRGKTNGLGLYKYVETENDKALDKAKSDIEDMKRIYGPDFQGGKIPEGLLAVPEIKTIPRNLSEYITFLHPWMNEVLNQIVLMIMFLGLVFATIVVLRLKDFF